MAIQGREGLSNTFAMALWLVDYSLWAGSHVRQPHSPPYYTSHLVVLLTSPQQNIRRLHFHQGTDYRYNSWQPISTPSAPAATRPPYYGQIMTASALANITDPRIVPILLTYDSESAYGIYSGNELAKIVVVNMRAFFSNSGDEDGRPEHYYRFDVSGGNPRKTRVERLVAAGAESTGNVTFGGVSYDCNAGGLGRPVQVARAGEMLDVEDGVVGVHVQDSSAVLLTFV